MFLSVTSPPFAGLRAETSIFTLVLEILSIGFNLHQSLWLFPVLKLFFVTLADNRHLRLETAEC